MTTMPRVEANSSAMDLLLGFEGIDAALPGLPAAQATQLRASQVQAQAALVHPATSTSLGSQSLVTIPPPHAAALRRPPAPTAATGFLSQSMHAGDRGRPLLVYHDSDLRLLDEMLRGMPE